MAVTTDGREPVVAVATTGSNSHVERTRHPSKGTAPSSGVTVATGRVTTRHQLGYEGDTSVVSLTHRHSRAIGPNESSSVL